MSEYNRLAGLITHAGVGAGAPGSHARTPSAILAMLLSVLVTASVYFLGLGAAAAVLAATPFFAFAVNMFFMPNVVDADRSGASSFSLAATDAAFRTAGVAYLALPFSYLMLVKTVERGEWWIMYLMLVIWAADTFAYFTGRAVGRTKLAPRISPGKTIEGGIGGLIGAAISSLLFNHLFGLGMDYGPAIVIAIIIGVVAIFGDLAESVLKRAAGVKDSGAVIPGHGGILDRVDSLVFATPVLYYFILWQANP